MKFQILFVSLVHEINKIYFTIKVMKKYYPEIDFVLVVPKNELKTFQIKFSDFNDINIVDENKIINKAKYISLYKNYIYNNGKFKDNISGWYYQQLLKLNYCLVNSIDNKKPIVIWDADTIPLKKINFFSQKNNLNLYASKYEYLDNYYLTNKIILGDNIHRPKYSFVTQFSVLREKDKILLREAIFISNKRKNIINDEYFILRSVLNAVSINLNQSNVNIPFFSEYELIGTFLLNKYKIRKNQQKPINFFRDFVDGKLNNFQKSILIIFDFKHLTYEKHIDLNKNQTYYNLLLGIFLNFFPNFKKYFTKTG